MVVELTAADDPKALVPGDPEQIWEMADSLGGIGVAFEDIGLGFRTIDDGGWRGAAADAFHGYFDGQPQRFLVAADAFVSAAVALDTYACALSWAQRQAAEAMALARAGESVVNRPDPAQPSLTLTQQVEQTGVLANTADDPATPRKSRAELRASAVDTLTRARGQLRRIGHEAAAKIRAASQLAPRRSGLWEAIQPTGRGRPGGGALSIRSIVETGTQPDVAARHPAAAVKRHLDHETLRDNPTTWEAGVAALRKRLRRLGLDQLSPRLKQHLFEGHFKKRSTGKGYRDVGYHHREGGVDRGPVRVLKIVAGTDVDGVYKALVAGPKTEGGPERKLSTFFPDSWTRDEVLRAIRYAFVNRTFDLQKPGFRSKWQGEYNGVGIIGYVERQYIEPSVDARSARLYHIITAYPLYKGRVGD